MSLIPRSSFALAGSALGASALGLVTAVTVPFLLEPSEYAIFSLTLGLAQFVTSVGNEWLRICMVRFGGPEHSAEDRRTIASLYVVLVCVMFALGSLTLLLSTRWPTLLVFGILLVSTATQGAFDGRSAAARARFDNWRLSLVTLARPLVALVFVAGFALASRDGLVTFVGLAASFPLCLLLYRDDPSVLIKNFHLDWKRARSFIAFGASAALGTNAAFAIPALLRVIVIGVVGANAAGAILFAFDLAQRTFAALGTSLNMLVIQMLIRDVDGAPQGIAIARARRFVSLASVTFFGVALAFVVTARPVAEIFLPPSYQLAFPQAAAFMFPVAGLLYLRQYVYDAMFIVFQKSSMTAIAPIVAVGALALVYLFPMGRGANVIIMLSFILTAALVGFLTSFFTLRMSDLLVLPYSEIFASSIFAIISGYAVSFVSSDSVVVSFVLKAAIAGFMYLMGLLVFDVCQLRSRDAGFLWRKARHYSPF